MAEQVLAKLRDSLARDSESGVSERFKWLERKLPKLKAAIAFMDGIHKSARQI
jgi:hypothetical protein